MNFRKVTNAAISKWGSSTSDRLAGVTLQNGDQLEVRFPDGTIEKHIVTVVDERIDVPYDGVLSGGGWSYSHSYAYIFIKYHGASLFRVRLCGTELKARRICQQP